MDEEISVFDSLGNYLGRFISAGGGGAGCFFAILLVVLAITIGLPILLLVKGIGFWREGKKEVAIACWLGLAVIIAVPVINYSSNKIQEANAGAERQQAEQTYQQRVQKAREAVEKIPQNASIDKVEITPGYVAFTITNHGEYPLWIYTYCSERQVVRLRVGQKWVDEFCTAFEGPKEPLPTNSSGRYRQSRVNTREVNTTITALCVPAWIQIKDGGLTLQFPEKNPPFLCKELTKPAEQQAVPPTSGATPIIYVVQKGDTLGKIAAQYKVSVESIAKLNNIQNVDLIVVGQRLTIPTP